MCVYISKMIENCVTCFQIYQQYQGPEIQDEAQTYNILERSVFVVQDISTFVILYCLPPFML